MSQTSTSKKNISKLEKEMDFFEANVGMEELGTKGDRLMWWKKHEVSMPLLSKIAKQIIGIPCSSSMSEQVFSTGAMIVTKKRYRLKAQRVENLIVIKENRKLIEEFKEVTSYKLDNSDNDFQAVVLESNTLPSVPAQSSVFDLGMLEISEEGLESDYWSDEDFEVVLNEKVN